MAKENIQRPRGTQDVSPRESYIWQMLENRLHNTARIFGFRETRFPAFEHTELFLRGVGETTDVVQKEMYTFTDKAGRSITLRPEGTASVVRAYIENGEAQFGSPYKVYYIAPNFRYEAPQKGRLRQHHQFGVECFGSQDFTADAEVIALAAHYLRELSIKTELNINSIGCPKCRPDYHKSLRGYFENRKAELCQTCLTRLEKNPMRILDCKSEQCQAVAADAPKSLDYLCDECLSHFGGLKSSLDAMGIEYTVNTKIVRGLDYYTKTVFEFISGEIGAQGTVCAGGRYDGLVEELGGPSTPGVGFGSGLERLILAAQAANPNAFGEEQGCHVYLAGADEKGRERAFLLAHELRSAFGLAVETDLMRRGVKAQMKHADRIKAKYTAVIGESEIDTGTVALKNMETGEKCDCGLSAAGLAANIY